MNLLIDTHIFLWYVTNDRKLTDDLRDILRDPDNELFLSTVSAWEICIKHTIGKLPLPDDPKTYIPDQRRKHLIRSLELTEESAFLLADLPPLHNDPFDRILICQSLHTGFSLVAEDANIAKYPAVVGVEVIPKKP